MSPTFSSFTSPALSSKCVSSEPSACSQVAPRETMKPCLSGVTWSPGVAGTYRASTRMPTGPPFTVADRGASPTTSVLAVFAFFPTSSLAPEESVTVVSGTAGLPFSRYSASAPMARRFSKVLPKPVSALA